MEGHSMDISGEAAVESMLVLESEEKPQEQRAEMELPRWQSTFWFSILWLIYWFDWVDRQAIHAIFPAIKSEYGLSDTQLGLVSGVIGFSISLLGVPAAYLVDKWSRKYMVTIMVAVWSAATWLSGLAANYAQLILARLGVGAGEAGYNPAAYSFITAWYPQKRRGTMVGIFNMAQPLAAFSGVGIAGWVATHYGWRSVFGLLAVPGFFLAVLMLFCPDYKTKKVKKRDGPVESPAAASGISAPQMELHEVKAGFRQTLRYVLKSPTILLCYLYMPLILIWAFGGFGTWAPTFFGRTFNLDMAEAGFLVMFVGMISCIGPILGGFVSDYLVRRIPSGRLWAAIIFIVGCALGFGSSIYLAIMGGSLYPVTALWTLGHICVAAQWGMSWTVIMELVPPMYRGLSYSLQQLFGLPAAVGAAVLSGALSDVYGLQVSLFIVLLVGCLPAMAILYLATRTYARDLARLKAQGEFMLNKS